MRLCPQAEELTPICRCRVLYLGSAIPHTTKDGLQGIQEPLHELYPEQGVHTASGIDSWLSVWSNGLLIENIDEKYKRVTRFFPKDSLHYCAAVRHVLLPKNLPFRINSQPQFLPLDSLFTQSPNPVHPPLFAVILRRTTGIKVLECHAFICKREIAANALVRCCFHACANFSYYARQIQNGGATTTLRTKNNGYRTSGDTRNKNGRSIVSNSIKNVEDCTQMLSSAAKTGSILSSNSPVQISKPNVNLNKINETNFELSKCKNDSSDCYYNDNHLTTCIKNNSRIIDKKIMYREYNTMPNSRVHHRRQITNIVSPPPPPPLTYEKNKSKRMKDYKNRKRLLEGSLDDELYCNGNSTLIKTRPVSIIHGYTRGLNSISGGTMMSAVYPSSEKYTRLNGAVLSHNSVCQPKSSNNSIRVTHNPSSHLSPMKIISSTLPFKPQYTTIGSCKKVKHTPILVPVSTYMMMPGSTIPSNLVPIPSQPIIYKETTQKLFKSHVPIELSVRPPTTNEELIYIPSAYFTRPTTRSNFTYNTGIYKRKKNLNEETFSYSVRQDRQSRSYGSLTNVQFAPRPMVPNGINRKEIKEEREIIQIMRNLQLSGDKIKHSEQQAINYQSTRKKQSKFKDDGANNEAESLNAGYKVDCR